ncbi:MAG: hypothetical protein CMR00_05835 [[Chlorobium] sp. 445]|nr:MAG: hypothetical protein CMR00_05835 [[Chlorobium] sp. 445]
MAFTPEELALIAERAPFELKLSATEKLKTLMERIRKTYLLQIEPHNTLCPEQTDFLRGQIAKGENYEGYPYVMLDFPKFYGKGEIFTYRTMFWYGHYFIFSLILAGTHLDTYRERLRTNMARFAEKGFLVAKSELWDWRQEAFLPLDAARTAETLAMLNNLPFLKLVKLLEPTALADEERLLEEAKNFYCTTALLTTKEVETKSGK